MRQHCNLGDGDEDFFKDSEVCSGSVHCVMRDGNRAATRKQKAEEADR